MFDLKKEYDLIFSIGGGCASAMQLKIRGKRPFSLPFDWLFHVSDQTIYALADCFRDGFKNWMLFENLRELAPEERGDGDKFQYEDTATGYRFIHDFIEPKETAYQEIRERYGKRINRLCEHIETATNILILADITYKYDEKPFLYLKESLETRFPGKKFDIMVIGFNENDTETEDKNGIGHIVSGRNRNRYDFSFPVWEWKFLDDITSNIMSIPPSPPPPLPQKRKPKGFIERTSYRIWKHFDKKLKKKNII